MTRFQPFNDLPAAQQEALKRDVEVRGIVNPILVDEDGQTIDGHQRRRVAAELGIECPSIVLPGLSDDEKLSLAIALNTFRRHLTGTERSKALQQMALLGMSTRRIAEATGLSQSTVARELRSPESSDSPDEVVEIPKRTVDPETGEITAPSGSGDSGDSTSVETPEAAAPGADEREDGTSAPSPAPNPTPRVVGKDGKSYPATKPKPETTAADDLAARIAASDVGYRAAVSRETSKTRDGLLTLDPDRAAAICLPDDRSSAVAFVADVRGWLDSYERALRSTNLRSVK